MTDLAGGPPVLDVRRVPIGALRPHEKNYNHGDVELIRESIREHGIYRPVIVARDGTILAGRHVYKAVIEEGHTEVDVVVRDLDPDSREAKRLMVVDNYAAKLAREDPVMLREVLDDIAGADRELWADALLGSGFSPASYQALIDSLAPPVPPEEFPSYDGDLPTSYCCPGCGYEWSGDAQAGRKRGLDG